MCNKRFIVCAPLKFSPPLSCIVCCCNELVLHIGQVVVLAYLVGDTRQGCTSNYSAYTHSATMFTMVYTPLDVALVEFLVTAHKLQL